MSIEYIPLGLKFKASQPEQLKNREVDVVCKQCGILGGGTLTALIGITTAKEHQGKNPTHDVSVVEVVCFM